MQKIYSGSTQIWTGVAGFKVQSANRYTIEPRLFAFYFVKRWFLTSSFEMTKSLMNYAMKKKRKFAPTRTRTEVAGVKVRRDCRYTIGAHYLFINHLHFFSLSFVWTLKYSIRYFLLEVKNFQQNTIVKFVYLFSS